MGVPAPGRIGKRSVTLWLVIWKRLSRILGAFKPQPVTKPHTGMGSAAADGGTQKMIYQESTDRPPAPAAKCPGGFAVDRPSNLSVRQVGKWCAYVLVLVTPGTFVILPALWLIRRFVFPSR